MIIGVGDANSSQKDINCLNPERYLGKTICSLDGCLATATLLLMILVDKSTEQIPQTFSSVQSLSHVQLFATPRITTHQASLSITNCRSSLRLMSIESVMPSSHLILCHPLLLLPSIFPSIRVFCNESALCIRCPKYWSFSFNISPSNEHSGLISFRMDWLHLLAVQGTLKSLLQQHNSKASILQNVNWYDLNKKQYEVAKKIKNRTIFSSVQFSRSVMSDSL